MTVFKRTRGFLAILALSSVFGCTPKANFVAPTRSIETLRIYATDTAAPLLNVLSASYDAQSAPLRLAWDIAIGNQESLLNRLNRSEMPYFLTQQLPQNARLWAAPLAQDALVFVMHPANGVGALTLNDLRRIYAGVVVNWRELGGADLPIVLFSREAGADVRAEFERLVMGQRRTSPNAQVLPSSEAMQERVAGQVGAIGYLPLSQTRPDTPMISLEGAYPTRTSLEDATYPLRLTVYIVGREEPSQTYRAFVAWAQSDDGQSALGTSYAPLPR
jgi:ABC-type phosphate transport system substrate-binding protein